MTKNHLIKLVCMFTLAVFLPFSSAMASQISNWTETFQLKGGNFVTHTPSYVNLDGWLQSGNAININSKSLNGAPLNDSGLHIKVESTREQFVEALV